MSLFTHMDFYFFVQKVHDPESPGGAQGSKATLGDLIGLEKMVNDGTSFDMIDGGDYDADKAYKDSKVREKRIRHILHALIKSFL